jgi:hypothetical protein
MTYDIVLFTDSFKGWFRIRTLGAYRLASELRKHGYTVKVIDYAQFIFQNHRLTLNVIKKLIGENTIFVGFSGTHFSTQGPIKFSSPENESDQEIIEARPCPYPVDQKRFSVILSVIKRLNRNTKIVYGGHWTRTAIEFDASIDYVVKGLADATIVELANHLKHGTPLKFMPGAHPGQKLITHDSLGLSFDFPNSFTKFERSDHIRNGEVICLETSRGCMFECKFCTYVLLGRKKTDPKYHKEIDIITQELKYNWDNFKINKYYIVDDTFNETTGKLEAIKQAVIQAGVPDFSFFAYLRLDLIKKHPEQIQLLKEMGLKAAYFGIESLNDDTLKIIGKPMKSSIVKEFLGELKSAWGNQVMMQGSFIFGLPYDTPETVSKWMGWLEDHNCPLDFVNLGPLHIFNDVPSVFGLDIKKYGYSLGEPTDKYIFNNEIHWKTDHWDVNDAALLVEKYMEKMYLSKRNKVGAYEVMGLQDLGYKFSDIQTRAKIDYDNVEVHKKMNTHRNRYLNELCKYEDIEVEKET